MAYSPEELRRRYKSLSKSQREQVSQIIEQQTGMVGTSLHRTAVSKPPNLTHRATGRLVFDDGPDGPEPQPLHNMTVELWDQDSGHHDYLGYDNTDRDGNFEIWYDPDDIAHGKSLDVQIRVYDHEHVYDRDGELDFHAKLIYSIDGHDNVTLDHYDFGQLAVPYWAYDPHKKLARVHVVEHGSPPQSFSRGRAIMLVKHAARVELQNKLHHAEHLLNPHLPSLKHIQHSYPANLTTRLEKEQPGYTRGDEFFGERILNGMSASVLDRDPEDPNRFWLHHHWTSYEQDNVFATPNVDIWFELQNELMIPVEDTGTHPVQNSLPKEFVAACVSWLLLFQSGCQIRRVRVLYVLQ